MRITTKGQVTIPAHIRSYLELAPHSEVDFEIVEDKVVLIKLAPSPGSRSRFSRLRGTLKGKHTTDEWMRATRRE